MKASSQVLHHLANMAYDNLISLCDFQNVYFMFSAGISHAKALEIKKLIVKHNGSICLNIKSEVYGVYIIPQSTTWKPTLSYATSKKSEDLCAYSTDNRGNLSMKPLKKAHSVKDILANDNTYEQDKSYILQHKLHFISEQDILHILELKEIDSEDWFIQKGLSSKLFKNGDVYAIASLNSSHFL